MMKTKSSLLYGTVLLLALLLSACGSKEYKPEPINEDVDKCVMCNMAVKDDPYATQIITVDGQSLKFDDIGCMNEWKTENGTDAIGAEFVRDHNHGDWVKYETAYYAYHKDFKTPMAYGIISFASKASAEAYVQEQGKGVVLSSGQLADHTWEVNRDMMDMEMMKMHEEQHHSAEGGGSEEESGAHGESDSHSSEAGSHS
ncbi:nitrous oxide reductase accessory protein NosL [Paenibacillus soyae]|uniref:Nitrous oxide reductase accessory protein NosL n=1 Tax=Paenibacillus soyae TaxID=2969249 RepID=A0A9X2MMF7_9BACL|nr:nitrous oxide reductase accessory protein NosL [Paenibacillus soyae]MCR2802757.1 nitrous oxide reductase accessory protein NosL [Paenibacillus soyae]